MTSHTVRINTLTEDMCRKAGLPLTEAGKRAVVEWGRRDLVKVCRLEDDLLPGTTLEDVAEAIAHTYKATFWRP